MTVKKAELHVHLEGTIPPYLAKIIAKRNQLTLPDNLISTDGTSYQYRDFFDFLHTYDAVAAVIKYPRDYYDLTFDYLKTSASYGSIYVELSYSPDHAKLSSGIASIEHLYAIQQAIDDARVQFNIVARVIIIAVRHFGPEAAINAAKQALIAAPPCLVGFGLGGDEINFPPQLFKKSYAIASEGGLHCTIHAGEFANACGINAAIDYLPIKRIGHGVMAIHSPETMSRLIDNNIALEICPSSNIALGLFKNMANHPLQQLKNAGIKVSLNSDDPPFFKTLLHQEYDKVQQFYHYSDTEMLDFTRMALEVAFVDEPTKLALLASL